MKQAQITIEYLLFFAFMILVLLVVLGTPRSKMRQGVADVVNGTAQSVTGLIEEDMKAVKGLE